MPEARDAVERDDAGLGGLESNGSMVCMIGGGGSLPSNMARTKSRPAIEAMTSSRRDAVFDLGGGLVVHGAVSCAL